MNKDLIDSIKLGEGLRLKPYRCKANKLTIGYGRNLDEIGISEEEAEILLENDILLAEKDAKKLAGYEFCNQARKNVLIEMVFNLGLPKLLGFKKMLKALEEKDYDEVANQMLDSKWAKEDVGERAIRLAKKMRGEN